MQTFIIGLSLGQARDSTGLCILELTGRESGRVTVQPRFPVVVPHRPVEMTRYPELENVYAVRHLERLAAGTPYPEQVARVAALRHDLFERQAETTLIVDQTGTGTPVTEMFKRAELSPKAAILTAADTASHEGGEYRIPRRDLVSSAQVLLQSQRLVIASSLPLAAQLITELLAFKATITLQRETRNAPPEPWRETPHDDLVLAVSLAAWYGEQQRRVQTTGFDLGGVTQSNVWDT